MTEATKASTAEAKPKKEKAVMQYAIDGVPITNPSVNSLSGVAYFHTKGVAADKPHIKTVELMALLVKAGVTEPKTTAFTVTLPNGKVLSATVGTLAPKVERVKKADRPEAVAEKQKNVDRVERVKQSQAEATLLKKWKDGGEVGPRPDTSTLDELTTLRAAKPTKGAKKVAAQAGKVTIKPATKGTGRTAKKAPARKAAAPAAKTGAKTFRGPIPKPGAAKKAAAS